MVDALLPCGTKTSHGATALGFDQNPQSTNRVRTNQKKELKMSDWRDKEKATMHLSQSKHENRAASSNKAVMSNLSVRNHYKQCKRRTSSIRKRSRAQTHNRIPTNHWRVLVVSERLLGEILLALDFHLQTLWYIRDTPVDHATDEENDVLRGKREKRARFGGSFMSRNDYQRICDCISFCPQFHLRALYRHNSIKLDVKKKENCYGIMGIETQIVNSNTAQLTVPDNITLL